MILACHRDITVRIPYPLRMYACCTRKGNRPRGCRHSRLHNDMAWALGTCLTRSSLPSAASPFPPRSRVRALVHPSWFSEAKKNRTTSRPRVSSEYPRLSLQRCWSERMRMLRAAIIIEITVLWKLIISWKILYLYNGELRWAMKEMLIRYTIVYIFRFFRQATDGILKRDNSSSSIASKYMYVRRLRGLTISSKVW